MSILLAAIAAVAMQAGLTQLPDEIEATSLTGKPLERPKLTDDTRKKLEDNLARARKEYEAQPGGIDATVWVGRRLAYLGRFKESIEWYTQSLEKHGADAKLLRNRGHRYLTTRQFDKAVADFERAAQLIKGKPDEIEPDGVANARNTPISSLHSNIWYHLALAHFLKGNFDKALGACEEGMKVSGNPDRLVSQTYWRYLILRRLGRDAEAKKALEPIHKGLDLIENHSYLKLLLVYKGELKEEEVLKEATGDIDNPTVAFGLGSFHLLNGDKEKARQLFERAVSGPSWPAFGFLAAEAELQRLK